MKEYILHLHDPSPSSFGPSVGERGFPGQWSPTVDPEETIPGLYVPLSENEPKQTMILKPMSFTTLAELAHDSPIVALEGKIISLYAVKKGEGQYGPWVIQNGVISDGNLRHDIAFMSEECLLDESMKNKTIRITAQESKGKPVGIKLTDKIVKEKPKRTVEVKWPAKVEVIGEGATQSTEPSSPRVNSETASNSPTQIARDPGPSQGFEPVEVRVAKMLDVFKEVCDQTGHEWEKEMGKLSAEKLAEWTTSICMSFKGQYGVYQSPAFAAHGDVDANMAKTDALIERAQTVGKSLTEMASPTPTSHGEPVGWREFLHAKSGVKLGDMEEEDLGNLIDRAQTFAPKTPDGHALKNQLLLADAELRTKASKKVAKALSTSGLGTEFDEGEVDEVCQELHEKDFVDLHYGQLVLFGNNLAEHVAKAKALWTAKQVPVKSPKKPTKPAPVSLEEDEPEDMPA